MVTVFFTLKFYQTIKDADSSTLLYD